jgi:hypothetical protein
MFLSIQETQSMELGTQKGDEINCATLQKFIAQSLLLYLVKVSKKRALLKSPMCDQRMEQ